MVLGWHVCGQLVVLVMCTGCGDMMWTPWRKHKQNAQDMAWLVRASFEIAWREAGGDASEWKAVWKKSRPRATLVAMGYIKEEDGFR